MAEKRLVRLITTTSMPALFRKCYTNQQKGGLLKFINWLKDDVGGNVILVSVKQDTQSLYKLNIICLKP